MCNNTGICSSCDGQGKLRSEEICDMCDGTGRCFCKYGDQLPTESHEDVTLSIEDTAMEDDQVSILEERPAIVPEERSIAAAPIEIIPTRREPMTRDDPSADGFETSQDDLEETKDESKTSGQLLVESEEMEGKSIGYACIMGISLFAGIMLTFIE